MKYRLSWGDPVCVREVLSTMYVPKLRLTPIEDMGYPPYEGLPDLVATVRTYLQNYKYVLITNGTTSSINIVLKALGRSEGRHTVVTAKHFFPYYPNIIEHAGYQQEIDFFANTTSNKVKLNLIDVPSNPWGNIFGFTDTHNNTIWDSVYASKVYINRPGVFDLQHRVNVGSFSKILGLPGLRLGWIATNSKEDYDLFYKEQQYSLCGVSMVGQDLLHDILTTTDLDTFALRAQNAVNQNRTEFEKMLSFFDNQDIPGDGMFYPVWVDDKGLAIIDRADVGYMKLATEGKGSLIRFNLAQNNELTKQAIKAIKTADRINKRSNNG